MTDTISWKVFVIDSAFSKYLQGARYWPSNLLKMKPRNKTAISPLLKKGHAHTSKKDYDRKREKLALKKELESNPKIQTLPTRSETQE